ncbi:MAG: hypothetical protein KKA70_07735 [Proteobacteria bacterium]|nr:hypothetical protein [Pseudomonadota bacterium]
MDLPAKPLWRYLFYDAEIIYSIRVIPVDQSGLPTPAASTNTPHLGGSIIDCNV